MNNFEFYYKSGQENAKIKFDRNFHDTQDITNNNNNKRFFHEKVLKVYFL